MDDLIRSVFIIGIVLTVVTVILGIILSRISFKGNFTIYYPFFGLFLIGLVLLLFATILERQMFFGAGLGGWGIACLFAAAVGFIVTAILDSFKHNPKEN